MNKKIITALILIMLFACNANAQTKKAYNDKQNMEVVLEKEPSFPAGEAALFRYFYDSISYTQEAISQQISGEVMISFDVLPDSTISNAQVISGLGYGIDEEVKRLLEKLKYSPSIQNGMTLKTNVIISIPVRARKRE